MGEHEPDHVFVGTCDGPLAPYRGELEETQFIDVEDLKQDVRGRPERYTPWFKISLGRVLQSRCAERFPPSRE